MEPESEAEVEQPRRTEQIYLKRVCVGNYRALENIEVELQSGVNVVIGPNNIGKSALLDAIRVALEVGKYRKTAFVRKWDFRDPAQEVSIDLYFHIPDGMDGFHELLAMVDGKHELQLHVRFKLVGQPGDQRVMPRYWGGSREVRKLDEYVLDALHAEYLGALRDASTELRPSPFGPLAELLKKLRSTKQDRDEIEAIFAQAQSEEKIQTLVGDAQAAIGGHTDAIALQQDQFGVQLNPVPPEFEKLIGNFEMKLLNGVRQSEVFQNGMGYNNILFISTVLGHIQQAKKLSDDEFYALLIEEPEAHLHPQLEDSLFAYICDLGAGSGAQIITTSHSPVIASQCDLDNINIICGEDQAKSISLKSLELDDQTKLKLSRFLDVTKSQLFFAKGVVLVEGISEALIMPLLADVHFGEKRSLTKRGIEIVNVGGVSFGPFAKLFNGEKAIPMKTVILTDKDDYDDAEGHHEMSATATKLLGLKRNFLEVSISDHRTFEADMWEAGNSEIMKTVYSVLHPRTTLASAQDMLNRLDTNFDKALFAQELAFEVESSGTELIVPEYIRTALEWAVGTEASDGTGSTA